MGEKAGSLRLALVNKEGEEVAVEIYRDLKLGIGRRRGKEVRKGRK